MSREIQALHDCCSTDYGLALRGWTIISEVNIQGLLIHFLLIKNSPGNSDMQQHMAARYQLTAQGIIKPQTAMASHKNAIPIHRTSLSFLIEDRGFLYITMPKYIILLPTRYTCLLKSRASGPPWPWPWHYLMACLIE